MKIVFLWIRNLQQIFKEVRKNGLIMRINF